MQHLVSNNIPIPKTLYTQDSELLKEQLDLLKGDQYIIKFLEGTHGLGVMLAESKKICYFYNRIHAKLKKTNINSRIY